MCCSSTIGKCLLIITNAVFCLLGAVLLAVGIFLLVDKSIVAQVLTNVPDFDKGETLDDVMGRTSVLQSAAIAMIVIGTAILIIGFLGGCGAHKENTMMLMIYGVLVFIVIASQVAFALVAYLYYAQVEKYVKRFLDLTLASDYTPDSYRGDGAPSGADVSAVTYAWDYVMAEFSCCGNEGYEDFRTKIPGWNATYVVNNATIKAPVPLLCCRLADPDAFPSRADPVDARRCLLEPTNAEYAHAQGCYQAIIDMMSRYSKTLFGVGIGIALLEVSMLISSCCLVRSIEKEKKYSK